MMNEGDIKFVKVSSLVDEVVKLIVVGNIFYVLDNGSKDIGAESSWHQFLVKCSEDDSFKSSDNSPKLAFIRIDLGNNCVHEESKFLLQPAVLPRFAESFCQACEDTVCGAL
jgi:hypothetical protein